MVCRRRRTQSTNRQRQRVLWKAEALSIDQILYRETRRGGGYYYSNAFTCALDAGGGDRVLLRLYDSCGGERIWLNGKEVTPGGVVDVTEQIRKKGGNTLVMLCSGEIVSPGSKVTFEVRPEVMVEGVSTELDMETGKARLHVQVSNMTDENAEETLSLTLTSMDNNAAAAERTQAVTLPAGSSTQSVELDMPDVIEWGYENPYIYKVSVSLGSDSYSDYVGFKSVSVDGDGFYTVNGERTFIKCAEISLADALGGVRDILNYVKTSGFNAVCVADGVPTEAHAGLLRPARAAGLLRGGRFRTRKPYKRGRVCRRAVVYRNRRRGCGRPARCGGRRACAPGALLRQRREG